ncbi:MAG: tetratricopeptide repeat protein [Acidobacteria bacterium]|nr:tetratricopeptide repeat protein [Acidobacteriota bacterium]
MRGQVNLPGGGPVQATVRFEIASDDGSRPPMREFTDSQGRFSVRLALEISYSITIESDEQTWATTVVHFTPSGWHPTLSVDLRPLQRRDTFGSNSVTAAELRQDVPGQARKEFDAAVAQMAKGNTAEGRAGLERAVAMHPDFVAAQNELAVLIMKDGALSEAGNHLRKALEVDPVAVRPLLNLGLCLYRQQRYTEAIPFLQKAVQVMPKYPGANLLLGLSLVMIGDDKSAEPVLHRAYETEGRRAARAQLLLSQIYARMKNYKRASVALDTYLRDVPTDPDAESLRATLAKLQDASGSASRTP